MTIQKPDFNQIFASQAPDVDKPPVFNNYNGGWGDESRPNNGKPTIKGFNYLQQLNDNKFLWIAQNGAFPYDPNTEYAVGVVTIKDGRFKQWNGTDWINFGQDDNALKSANNLSDLENKEASRNNLDVYSKIEVDGAISSAIPSDVPNATETTAGKAKIATTEIAQAGVNDTDFLTAKKLRDALNTEDGAPFFLFRAWLTVSTRNGTVYGGGNIASVVLSSTGIIDITFDKAMPNDNYAVLFGCAQSASGTIRPDVHASTPEGFPTLKTTTQLKVMTSGTTITAMDNIYIGVVC